MIYITGDIHGDINRFNVKKLKKDDILIVCGDFGFIWDGGKKEEKVLKKLGKKKYSILFLDGTHENFDILSNYPVVDFNGGKAQHICGNLYHLLRGEIYTINDKKIFVFGGGESSEKQLRIEIGKWWKQEMPTEEEMENGLKNLSDNNMEVDYIITHEPAPRTMYNTINQKDTTNQLEAYFEKLVKIVKFKKWFFGSMHIDRKITAKNYALFEEVIPIEAPQRKRFRE